MRWTGTALLALSLMTSVAGRAQVRGMGITPGGRASLRTAPGAARASSSLAFRGGGTFFNPQHGFNGHGGRFGQSRPFFRGASVYPYYYGYPYAYDYSGDYGLPYAPGTFDSDSGYPPQYAPPDNYYSPEQNYAPSSNYPPSGNYPPSSRQSSARAGGVTSTNGSEDSNVPTVLVFRDGHKLEVSNYAIMGSTLFVLAGQRAKIPVSDLDLPATVKANDERGTSFYVPNSAQQ